MQRVSVFIKIWDLSTLGSKKGIQIIYQKLYWLWCQFRRINDNCVEKKKKKENMHENKVLLVYQICVYDWIKAINISLTYTVMQNFGKKTIN